MNDSPDRDVAIFTEALGLPASERPAFLERACGSDPELRQRVDALLSSHNSIGDFLEISPSQAPMVARLGGSTGEKPGDHVGRYKLLQQIGEGGCGVVFMAEQETPVRRRVALKIIKPGMDTKSVIARFEAERQALALMDHPNIAKIFDAGATESGRPYFVMELVRGIKITEYCDQHSLPTEERLKLFIQVCQAIQHAHQKGIIHRDIKPSNILVTKSLEGAPLPMVIDFGIAKATTNQQLTDNTLFTAFEMLIGTPAYMSPEQAELTSVDVDTRTDIYSLGVLLYELLTGSTPFDTTALLKSGLDEIRRVIREREPRPSTRLSKMAASDLTTVAQSRQSEPSTLIRAIGGDLDWITMKALEKDRTRRYETAYSMALDIQRHLANEPVLARPTSALYRVQKLMRRNKLAFTAGTVVATILLLGIADSLWQARRERAAREESESILKFMTDILQSPDPIRDGRTITVEETLDQAAQRLENDLTDQPDRRANLQKTLAVTYEALGLEAKAAPLRKRILDYDLATLGAENTNTLADMGALANAYFAINRQDEAIKLQEKTLTLRRKVNGPEDPDTLVAMAVLANSYFATTRRDEALKLREEVLTLSQKLRGVTEDPATRAAMNEAAVAYTAGGEKLFEELALRKEVLALGRKVKEGRENIFTLTGTNQPAWTNNDRDGLARQIMLREQLRRLGGNANTPDSPVTAAALDRQADSALAAGHVDEGVKLKEQVLAQRQKMNGLKHPDTLLAMTSLAMAYYHAHRTNDSLKLGEDALALMEEADGPTHRDTLTTMMDLSSAYLVTGRIDKAVKLGEELLKRERQILNPERPDPIYRIALDTVSAYYTAAGRHEEALKLRHEGMTLRLKEDEAALALSLKQDPNSPATADHYASVGFSYHWLGHDEEAITNWQEAMRINPSGSQETAYWMGKTLLENGHYAEALPLLRATQKFYAKGNRSQDVTERLALAEAVVAGQDPLAPLQQIVAARPTDTDKGKHLATLYLWLGRTNEYEALCRKLLDVAANSKNTGICNRAAKACLIQPHPDPETLSRAIAVGRRALELVTTNDPTRGWVLITAGMALVRDGKPAEAEILLNEEISAERHIPDHHRLALAYRTLALAHQGRTEEALSDFAAVEYTDFSFPVPPALPGILLDPDLLATALAHEEARILLNLPLPPPHS